MNINLIKIYIDSLTKEQAKQFLENKSIFLTDLEFEYLYKLIKKEDTVINFNNNAKEYLYKLIKKDYKKIIDEDPSIMNDIKNNINLDNYLKLNNLLTKYKKYLK